MVLVKSLVAVATLSLANTAQAWYNDLPSCLSPFEPFVYTGCYDNGQPGQKEALSLRTDLNQQNMTVEACVAHCKGNDYRLAGLSYYGVCYCGQTVSTALLPEDQCTFPCTGNSSETCGGNTEISIWMDPTFPPLEDQTDIKEYVPVGCWTDDSSQGRALFYRQDNVNSSTLTTETCLKSCLSGGFPFAGTEYGGECYCGVVVGNGTSLATDPATCNIPCNGNASETCGGPSRLSLYVAKDLQSLEPCGTSSNTTSTVTTTPVTSTTSATSITPVTPTSPTSSCSTTSSAPVCTTTTVTPPTCEYQIGKWCSNPIPGWNDHKGCLTAWSQCVLQSSSCFLKAGFPDSLKCFEYVEWCDKLDLYCLTDCVVSGKCGGKPSFCNGSPPKGGNPPTTSTSTYPCPTTVTTTKTTTSTKPASSCPVATPTGICTQPTNPRYGYRPGHPVGGIGLPVVTCNNIKNDWNQGNVYKLYSDKDSHNCPSYPRPRCPDACADACKTQYQQCESTYAEGCRTGHLAQSYSDAEAACTSQYKDCLAVNRNVRDTAHCTTWYDSCW
ncbi:WSC domain-containing protein [Xylaria intraflava]|nr:WSC domain-containing protein [Xylaria intraflava]